MEWHYNKIKYENVLLILLLLLVKHTILGSVGEVTSQLSKQGTKTADDQAIDWWCHGTDQNWSTGGNQL